MRISPDLFHRRYGPWALIAGGSEGLGAAFAEALASQGLNLVLIARRREVLAAFAKRLTQKHAVQVECITLDLSDDEALAAFARNSSRWNVGLLVCNAALSPVGDFLEQPLENHYQLINLNCRSVTTLVYAFGRRMVERGTGGIIVVSSMAGLQGTAQVAHYAASKAYLRILGESLWAELRPRGVDVLTCCSGFVRTPTFMKSEPKLSSVRLIPIMKADQVVTRTLASLGRRPLIVPGVLNTLVSWTTQRLLPRRTVIELASSGTRSLYPHSNHSPR